MKKTQCTNRKKIIFVLGLAVALLASCEDRYPQGYDDGYADGYEAGRQVVAENHEDDISEHVSSRSVTTEVCGGGGVNVNGKHVPPGPTGCVRVYSDGTFERY
ncbi:MAG: hypothetical protein JRE23_16825 [Deltaproteobacteria bacterium]|nr:hypothetical protein [Deltaproteobacteria bacterium]